MYQNLVQVEENRSLLKMHLVKIKHIEMSRNIDPFFVSRELLTK